MKRLFSATASRGYEHMPLKHTFDTESVIVRMRFALEGPSPKNANLFDTKNHTEPVDSKKHSLKYLLEKSHLNVHLRSATSNRKHSRSVLLFRSVTIPLSNRILLSLHDNLTPIGH